MKIRLHIILTAFCVLSTTLQAQKTIYVGAHALGTAIGDTWTAACDLETAVSMAVAGQQIWVQRGTYRPSGTLVLREGVKMYGGFVGTEDSTNQRDPRYTSLIDAQENYGPVVRLGKGGVLDGFTVQNGARNGQAQNGGGVYAYGNTVIENCKITNNSAYNGGGVFAEGDVEIINCIIRGNKAKNLGYNMYGYCFSVVNGHPNKFCTQRKGSKKNLI